MRPARAKTYTPPYQLFGIHNGSSGFWTGVTFKTEAAAKRHMEQFWGKLGVPSCHKVIPVTVTIEDAREEKNADDKMEDLK